MQDKQVIALYARISSGDEDESNSIPDQLREARDFVSKRWPNAPIAEYSEIGSASTITGRPQFCKLLASLNEGKISHVIVRDQDRLSRDTTEMLGLFRHLNKSGVEIWIYRSGQQLKSDSPTEKLMLTLLSGVSEFERSMAAVRTKSRITSLRNDGKWTGGATPRGYKIIAGKLIPSEQAPLVRRVFEVAATTKSLAEAFRYAKGEGLWAGKQSVLDALGSRTYLGEYKTPASVLKGHHEPLISEALFDAAQMTTRLAYEPNRRKHDRVFELEGLVRCQHCGRLMTNYHVKKPSGLRIYYYACVRTAKTCLVKRIPAADFEAWVWAQLNGLCESPRTLRLALENYQRSNDNVNRAEIALLAELQNKHKTASISKKATLDFMMKLFSEGMQPELDLNTKLAEFNSKLADLDRQIAETKAKLNPKEKLDAESFLRGLRAFLTGETGQPARRRSVIRSLLRQIIVRPDGIDFELKEPAQGLNPLLNGSNGDTVWGG